MTSSESAVDVQLAAIDPLPVSSLLMSYLSSIFIGDGFNEVKKLKLSCVPRPKIFFVNVTVTFTFYN